MHEFTLQQHKDLLSKLEILDDDPHSEKYVAGKRIELILATLNRILEKLKGYSFPSEKEEVHFFKTVLPPTVALLVYYLSRNEWEAVERIGTVKAKQDFMEKEFRKIYDFCEDNEEFFKYYRSGRTNLDKYYFQPKRSLDKEEMDLLATLMDPSFCTIYCFKAALFLAYVRLEMDMLKSLHKKKNGAFFKSPLPEETQLTESRERLEWTLPKIALIELIYALKAVGAFNHGRADLKRIARCFEQMLSVDLGNITRSYQEIMARKAGHTLFLDQLKEKMLIGIDRTIGRN